jgi:hypothetical protein
MAADLREFAGLLGSHLTAALTQQRPLTVEEHLAFERTRGRLDQVRDSWRCAWTTRRPATPSRQPGGM